MFYCLYCLVFVKKTYKSMNNGAFAWILWVLHYSILKCHKNCHKFKNSLERAYWIEQIKSVLVETPLNSTIYFFQHDPPWSWLKKSFFIQHLVNPSSTGIWTWWADIREILISPISLIFNDRRLDPFELKGRNFCNS